MQFAGANSHAEPIGLEALPGRSNYFIGDNAARWQTGVPHYAKLLYEDILPGIDLLYYWSADGNLEYDFVVEPGADPGAVQLRFDGPEKLEISETGDLIAGLGQTRIYHRKPVIYQEIDGDRRPVSGAYRIEGRNRVGFQLAAYDRTLLLVIDPVLEYSTFVGGSDRDREASIAADADGNVYLTAGVRSGDFPTTMGAFDETHDSAGEETGTAIFKLGPDGTTLLFSTFLGGSLADVPRSHGNQIALDASGNIYVSGHTTSPDFPTTAGAFDETHNGEFDMFLSVLDPAGATLLYSTYLGGAARDNRPCIALDGAGDVYLAGITQSPSMPTTPGAFDATYNGGIDVYIAKLRPAGNGAADLLYASFLGGQSDDNSPSMTIDDAGVVHIVGETESEDFPTTPGAFSNTHNGGATRGDDQGDDLFVVKFDPNPAGGGTEDLLYSTFFGGSSEDDYTAFAPGIAVDQQGDIYFTGETISRPSGDRADYPLTRDAIDPDPNLELRDTSRLDKVIIARLRPNGQGPRDLIYSSFWGGMGENELGALAYDSNGFLYISGVTDAPNFPTQDPVQAENGGGRRDGFVSVFTQGGRRLLFSTYLGGSGEERHINVLPHPTGIFVAGHTDSADFPTTTGAFDTTQNGEREIFVSKITDLDFLPEPVGPVTTVSAASFLGPVAAESIASAFGPRLAPRTELASGVPLPTVLGDTSVQIVDSEGKESLGQLFFVASLQINFFIPAGVAPGPATVNVIVDGEVVATGDVDIQPVAPGLFFVGEQRIAAASLLRVSPDGSREPLEDVFTSNPIAPRTIDLGPEGTQVFLLLFGTGIRGFSQEVTATVGGEPTAVLGAVRHGVFVGLDQVNIGPLPRSLIGRGDVEVVLTVDGILTNPVTVRIQ